jgi:hypothetical protein
MNMRSLLASILALGAVAFFALAPSNSYAQSWRRDRASIYISTPSFSIGYSQGDNYCPPAYCPPAYCPPPRYSYYCPPPTRVVVYERPRYYYHRDYDDCRYPSYSTYRYRRYTGYRLGW